MVAVTAAYTVNSPYCIADAVESEPTGPSRAELEAIRSGADVAETPSFSPSVRAAPVGPVDPPHLREKEGTWLQRHAVAEPGGHA